VRSLNVILDKIKHLGENWQPEILHRSKKGIVFREVEDLIAWVLRNRDKIKAIKIPAWRFRFCEDQGNRYYYMLEVSSSPPTSMNHEWLKLIAGDATDYSGHGLMDKHLVEVFTQNVLRLPMEDRPAADLVVELVEMMAH